MNLTGRRAFLGAAGAAFFATKGLFADVLSATPQLTEGPYYPDNLPLDRDNDLIILGDSVTPAIGEITQVSGRLLNANGSPLRNATIEIWQADSRGIYICSRAPSHANQDKNFQGFGQFETGLTGEYRFRTIKPVPYDGRAPHIHVKVKQGGRELLTTQIFINGHPMNARDGVMSDLRNPIDRELVIADFLPVAGSPTGELAAKFDIVLGRTPGDRR